MGSDLVVALGGATVHGVTLFGLNCHRPAQERQRLVVRTGTQHAPGESVQTQHALVPQARQTWTVLGSQPEKCWGYLYGVNERQVAVGFANWRSRIPPRQPGLLATDVVRLTLERAASALQAVDVLTDLVGRHGQACFGGHPSAAEEDHVFLVADAHEAFVIEAAETHWALQEIRQTRAVSDVGVIRQDWGRLSRGLGELAIDQGWWRADGSKLDFTGSLATEPVGRRSALRRWGRATFLLESQNGHIDLAFFRRLLADHYEDTSYEANPLAGSAEPVPLCLHDFGRGAPATAGSFHVPLADPAPAVVTAWFSFGPPCISPAFPVFVIPDALPTAYFDRSVEFRRRSLEAACRRLQEYLGFDPDRWEAARQRLYDLQTVLDHDAEEFARLADASRRQGDPGELRRQARQLMQHHLNQFDDLLHDLLDEETLLPGGVVLGRED